MKILVAGDIHAKFSQFREEIDKLKPDMVFSTGDFGFWPGKYDIQGMFESNKIPIYFCDGNHEDHEALSEHMEITEIATNVFYMPRGSVLTLPDGKRALFMGGARSIDRHYRTEGIDYFPEEELGFDDILFLDDAEKIDIVITHTKPTGIDIDMECDDDPSMEVLDEVFEMFHPAKWYFSHFHLYKKLISDGCEWVCLNQFDEPGWYEWIESY